MSADSSTPPEQARALRRLAVVGTAGSAVIHGYLFADGWSAVPVVGPLFAVNALTGAVIAVALMVSAHWVWRFLAVGFNGVSLLLLLLSHTPAGLFGVHEAVWDHWQVLALVLEGIAMVAAALTLLRSWRARR